MLDDISLKILKILQKKARIPNVEVARQVGMAPSAVLERIRKLEKQGFIDGYEVRLNPERFSRSLVAFITIKTHSENDGPGFVATLTSLPEVQEIHYISGADGYLLKVRVQHPAALAAFIHEKILPAGAVESTQTAIVLSTFKESAQIPIEISDTDGM
ncbi:MAG: Lrp/AsnC family transcriptional regulator [Desulfobacteraceae bacterium]|nr:Lrp/AsnC family transcriptional regulator [Desulfobacteraceae bacterium]